MVLQVRGAAPVWALRGADCDVDARRSRAFPRCTTPCVATRSTSTSLATTNTLAPAATSGCAASVARDRPNCADGCTPARRCAAWHRVQVNAHRGVAITALPPVLIVSLKCDYRCRCLRRLAHAACRRSRFEFNLRKLTREKVTDRMSFPLVLDMAPYLRDPRCCEHTRFELFGVRAGAAAAAARGSTLTAVPPSVFPAGDLPPRDRPQWPLFRTSPRHHGAGLLGRARVVTCGEQRWQQGQQVGACTVLGLLRVLTLRLAMP